jgi:hypothetical protein
MPNRWDPLPLPLLPDADEAVLFEALGRALERWECVENSLAFTYSLFVEDVTFRKMREYGANGRIFAERMNGLKRAARAWFVKNPSQDIEARFDQIALAAIGFADRRNEFAHGIVMDVAQFLFWRSQLTMAPRARPWLLLVPGLHVVRKHDATGMPTFGYSSNELNIIFDRLVGLEAEIDQFKRTVWPAHWPGAAAHAE